MLDYMIKTANELRDSGESIMRFQFIGKLLVFPLDGKSAQTLLQSTTELDKGDDYEFARAWLGRSVLLDGYGERWKSHRRLVTPTFHFAKLEGYLGVFNRETKVMVELLDEFAKSGETVDLFHYIKRCTLDIICGTAMGTTIDAQHNPTHSYVLAVERFNKLSVDHSMKAHLQIPFLFWLLGYQKKKDDYVYTMKKFTRDVTAGRMTDLKLGHIENHASKRDMNFLDILLCSKETKDWSEKDIREEVDTFMFAGHDTTAASFSWMCWNMAHNQDIQEKVYKEIIEIFGDDPNGDVDSEGIKKLDYTERVLKESKRRIAPVPTLQRKLREDMEIGGHMIPAGVNISVAKEMPTTTFLSQLGFVTVNYRIEPMLDFNGTQPSLEIISRPSNGIPVMLTRRRQSRTNNEFDKEGGLNLKPDFVYSLIEIRELLTNACKIPYIFFPNEDDEVYELLDENKKPVTKDVPVKVPFYNFAFSCVQNEIVKFLKPFVNFALIPKKEPKPLNDLLLQLGLNSETQNVFDKAKEHKFTTFFSGPKLIRDLIDPDFDTTDHQNFIQQFLVDERSCLKDGRNLLSDQLEKMNAFLTSTSDSKTFSTLFLDDYGPHKSSIDHELTEMLNSLNDSKIFENTTLIVTSYGLSEKDVETENEKNPLFAVRLSDKFMKNYQEKHYFMKMNFNSMLIELMDPYAVISTTPFKVQPTWRNCASEGISAISCVCMNMNLKSEYPEESEKNFLNQLRSKFGKEVNSKKCVRSFETEDYSFFYDYALNTKKELRGVELTGFANITGFSGEKTLMLKKMFTFKKDFESFQSFDTARVIVAYEVNIGIASMCDL
ncbi:hypothetical protein L5515_007956 [Caenorhabditis briggsae]|uniref:Cytochrome P450 n=1 Tax=Caenorhabditis briggsae TaxID=6238 RepID=A0AAE9JMX4_CAEBR|nr:hypothetical protein L5515_007956 [Caenorhabditis briggsae]